MLPRQPYIHPNNNVNKTVFQIIHEKTGKLKKIKKNNKKNHKMLNVTQKFFFVIFIILPKRLVNKLDNIKRNRDFIDLL